MKPFKHLICISAIVMLGSQVMAGPMEPPSTTALQAEEATNRETKPNEDIAKAPVTTPSPSGKSTPGKDLDASNSNQQTTYVLPEHHSSGGTGSGTGTYDPSVYAGYLTPEAFQQYLQQFTGAFGPYGYPGYGPAPVYPAPYAVQTGYDGFLVPTTGSTSVSASGTVSSNSNNNNIITALTNLLPTLMESTIFRVIITVIGAILMLLFGGAVTTAICNLTPLCDISFKAVTYLRGNGSGNVGRMLAEEVTPERVRRAAEFVRNAIRKYREMQNIFTEETNKENKQE